MKVKTSEKIRALRRFEELKCGVGGQQRALHQPPRVAAAAASVGDYAHCPFERHTGSSRWSCCQHCATIATDSATIAAAVLQLRDRLRAAAAAAVEAAEAPWHAGVSRRPPPPRAACQGRASATAPCLAGGPAASASATSTSKNVDCQCVGQVPVQQRVACLLRGARVVLRSRQAGECAYGMGDGGSGGEIRK